MPRERCNLLRLWYREHYHLPPLSTSLLSNACLTGKRPQAIYLVGLNDLCSSLNQRLTACMLLSMKSGSSASSYLPASA